MGKMLGIIYMDRFGFWMYIPIFQNVLKFVFPQNTVSDIELLNKEELERSILQFITNYKLPSCRLVMILSDSIIFEKDLPLVSETERVIAVQKTIDNIPFGDVGIKILTFEKGVKVLATNRTLYEGIKDIFEKKGLLIEVVAPSMVILKDVNLSSGLDVKSAQTIIKKYDFLKQYSFPINVKEAIKKTETKKENRFEKKNNLRLIILLILFIFLLLIMFGL